ncbi:Hypp6223 [Branchiostoma lanceolatum]|uniref:Hypp6223 protein n=1 Tax=Branchiostoma lanceolatum TaxID=7740 RepID=A0A8J9W6H3_BRALA|nr:Hypp6223 [Branchiostoma lanceolatum]
MERHYSQVHKEMGKKNPKFQVVDQLLDLELQARRELVRSLDIESDMATMMQRYSCFSKAAHLVRYIAPSQQGFLEKVREQLHKEAEVLVRFAAQQKILSREPQMASWSEALMEDQVKHGKNNKEILDGKVELVFGSPESGIRNKKWRDMLASPRCRENIIGIVVDDAHTSSKKQADRKEPVASEVPTLLLNGLPCQDDEQDLESLIPPSQNIPIIAPITNQARGQPITERVRVFLTGIPYFMVDFDEEEIAALEAESENHEYEVEPERSCKAKFQNVYFVKRKNIVANANHLCEKRHPGRTLIVVKMMRATMKDSKKSRFMPVITANLKTGDKL